MFSTIVVGTDGSRTAAAAVELAASLARAHGAKLHLVAAYRAPEPFTTGGLGASDTGESEAFLRAATDEMLKEVASGLKDLKVKRHSGEGAAAAVIVRVADEVGADLIVVGSKGMRGTRRILGSVPNTVAHRAGCHVLVAKTD